MSAKRAADASCAASYRVPQLEGDSREKRGVWILQATYILDIGLAAFNGRWAR